MCILKVSTFFADSTEEESPETIPAGPNATGQLPVACDGVLLLKEFERHMKQTVNIKFSGVFPGCAISPLRKGLLLKELQKM